MRKLPIRIFIIIITALLFVGSIGILFSMRNVDKLSDESTTSFSGTVNSILVKKLADNVQVEIHINESQTFLLISANVTSYIDLDDVVNLDNGQHVWFRVENNKAELFGQVDFVNIVSLETETKSIYSIDDYNSALSIAAKPARIAGTVLSVVFLAICILEVFYHKRQKKA